MSKKKVDVEYEINLTAMQDMSIGFYGMVQTNENMAAQHPKLKYLKSWTSYNEDIPVNNLMAYLLFLYSPDSPVNKRYGVPLMERKSQSLILAGFGSLRKRSGEWSDDVVSYLIELRNEAVIVMIVDYLKMLNMKVWTEMMTLEQELEESTRLRMRPVSSIDDKATLAAADIKSKLRRESRDMIEMLATYQRQFYGDAHHEELKTKVHEMITVESMAIGLNEKRTPNTLGIENP
jgi:hypothetical protein